MNSIEQRAEHDLATVTRLAREIESEAFVRPIWKHSTPQPHHRAPYIQCADDLLKRSFAPIRWAIGDMVPEGVTLLVGAPKVGKSWLALQFAIAIAAGSPIWAGRSAEAPGDVLLLGLEDNDRRMQSRIMKLRNSRSQPDAHGHQPDAPDVTRLHFATAWPRMDKGGLDFLDDWLERHTEARLVIVDTLGRFRPPDSGRSTAYQSDYQIGAALKPIADKHNVALLLLHHTRKQVAADVLDTVSGTQGLTGSVDALLMLRRERGQLDAALYVTGRDIEHEEDHALAFDAELCTWSSTGTAHTAMLTRERRDIVNFLSVHGGAKPKEIAEALGKKGPAIRRLLQKMFADGDIGVADGRYSLILSLGNSGNSSNGGRVGVSSDSHCTGAPTVTGVTGDGEANPVSPSEEW